MIVTALLLCVILTAGQAATTWHQLSIGRLPDNDDMMRLAEVRDWLAGQRFADLTQHRLGLSGNASMHWSRIADAGPAALLLALRPVMGDHAATLAMLIGYQAILLFCYLLLAARNAALLAGDQARPTAIVLAALAFPTVTLFVPGRIDHHALQIVLTMVTLGTLLAQPTFVQGLVGGGAAALSLAVGLEAAPELLVAIGVLGLMWLVRHASVGEDARLGGFAIGLGTVSATLLLCARPEIWPTQWCDGFTPASTSATLAASLALGGLALGSRALPTVAARAAAAAAVGLATGWYVMRTAAICLAGPYGALDPYLQRVWMSNVPEARGLFYNLWDGHVVSYGGLAFASLAALAVLLRDPALRRQWWPFALFLSCNVAAMVLQIRIAYILAGFAILPFAALMAKAQAPDRTGRRLLLWATGSGVSWAILATVVVNGLTAATAATRPAGGAGAIDAAADTVAAEKRCTDGRSLQILGRLPRGRVIAPLDSGAYVVGMTSHRVLAAPYHRNNAGNLAAYRFFFAAPDAAERMARRWGARYVVFCSTSLDQEEVQGQRSGSLIEALQAGRHPSWLVPVTRDPQGMSIYRLP